MLAELQSTSVCRGFGSTVWDRCFWVNNVGWIAGAVLFLVWVPPIVWWMGHDGRYSPPAVLPGHRRPRRHLSVARGVVTLLGYIWLLFGWVPGMLLGFNLVWPLWLRMLGYR